MALTSQNRAILTSISEQIAQRREGSKRLGRLPDHLRAQVLSLVHQGLSINIVASETGLSTESLYRWQRNEKRSDKAIEPEETAPLVFSVDPLPTRELALVKAPEVRLVVGDLTITISSSGVRT